MPGQLEFEGRLGELAARVALLDEQRRAALDALELAASSGDFLAIPANFERPVAVLADTAERVRRLLPFECMGFWLVDEQTSDFAPVLMEREEDGDFLRSEFDRITDERLVALALHRQRTVLAASSREGSRLVIHALATVSRVRGLMIGCIGPGLAEAGDAALAMLTILMQRAAATLEGMELYSLLRARNEALQEGLRRLAEQEETLRQEVVARKKAQRRLELMGQVFTGTIEATLVTDANGRVVEVNPAFTETTGWSQRDAYGRRALGLLAGISGREMIRVVLRNLAAHSAFTGEVNCRRRNGEDFPALLSASMVRDEDGKPMNYVVMVHDITEYKAKEEQIRYQAHHDALTGLPNRALLLDRLAVAVTRAGRRGARVGVFFLDVDDFKRINDSMGHPVGDELLCNIASRLASVMRTSDTVARLGGDEFVIMAEDLSDQSDAVTMCERIAGLFAEPFMAGGLPNHLTASVGVTVYPEDGDDPNVLIRNADLAMYRAKESGKGRWHLYTRQLSKRARKRLQMERLLRRAVERREIEVYYQPQLDLRSGRVIGVEALARWRRKGKIIVPGDFVPLAEESGLISEIGLEVLTTACSEVRSWNGAGNGALRLAVNVSPRQIEHGDLPQVVEECLAKTGFPAHRLEIEITETALMQSEDRVRKVLTELREMGVQVAIDDFGTGYSSLSHLRRFPIRSLKIDKGFVSGLPHDQNSASIVEAILSMAKSLGLNVVAEGIETSAHLAFLKERGCDSCQGFFFSKPVPPALLLEYLDVKGNA